jgi:hypothetical protein
MNITLSYINFDSLIFNLEVKLTSRLTLHKIVTEWVEMYTFMCSDVKIMISSGESVGQKIFNF